MSAMTVGEFREGEVNLFSGRWTCSEHAQTMKVGRECPFCVHDVLGDDDFNAWLDEQ